MERGTIFSSASLIQKYPALHSAFVISKMLLKIAVWSDSSSTVLSKSKNKQPPVFKMLVTLLVNHLDYLLFADMSLFFFFFPDTYVLHKSTWYIQIKSYSISIKISDVT